MSLIPEEKLGATTRCHCCTRKSVNSRTDGSEPFVRRDGVLQAMMTAWCSSVVKATAFWKTAPVPRR
jgi:hypothetical protein